MIYSAIRNFGRSVSAAAVAAVVLASGGAHAQTLFQPLTAPSTRSITLPTGNMPLGVAVADFNHDGYPDMVVANKKDQTQGTSGSISVYLSSGPGTFQAPVKYPTCGGPTAVLAEDLDLTGLPDIVVTCNTPSSNVIDVFLNLGNGTFNPKADGVTNIILGTGVGPVALVSGDFNNDGHPDLAVAALDGSVTLFLSNAANNFGYYIVKTISGLGSLTGITDGRFTTSGNLDLAVTDTSTHTVRILTGDGTGGFTTGSTAPTQANPTGIVAGDFNLDGKTDLAVVNADAGTVSILTGNGNGTFAPSSTITVGPASTGSTSTIMAMDILSNGRLDLVTANTPQNNIAVLISNGNGTFQAPQYYAVPGGPAYLGTGDFNRDGKPDLAVTQSTANTVSVLINNTLPAATAVRSGLNFLPPNTLPNGHGNMADGVALADFNHDGYPDIAATYLEDNAVRVLPGLGGGNFGAAMAYPVGKQPYWVVAADLTNNGYADLVTSNTGDNTVSVLMNKADGSGNFAPAANYTVGRLPYQVTTGDLNGDGIPDIAVANYGDNTVSILYGQPNGTFVGGQTLATCTNPYGVAIGDFRHTGQNDVAVTCFHTAQMEVFLNNGMLPYHPAPAQTTFQTPEIYTTDVFPTSLVLGDFNRDGNLDVVTGNSIANDVSFFAGHGDGTFSSAVNSFALNFPESIAAGDVNGDGILDLVTVASNFQQVAILLGKGDGSFEQRWEFAAGQQPWAVALADLNRDGKLDIVTANTVNRVNLTIPADQQRYMKEFPPTAAGGPSLNVLLNSSATTINLTAQPAGVIQYNHSVTLTATVTPALGGPTPTGTVIFEDTDGTASGAYPLNHGSATVTVGFPGSGTHQITVLYSGDLLYQPYTATGPNFVVTVSGTPVAMTFNPNPTSPSNPIVTYSVTIGTANASQPNPVGTITLYAIEPNGTVVKADGPNPVGTAGTGGVTMYSKTLHVNVPAGSYYGYAVFQPAPGNVNKAGSSPHVLLVSK